MRFIVMLQIAPEREAGVYANPPSKQDFEKMEEFTEGLRREGVLLEAQGLRSSSEGARIKHSAGKPVITDGPFTESKELIVGFSILQARSKEEVIERLKHWPLKPGEQVEIRQLFLYDPEDLV